MTYEKAKIALDPVVFTIKDAKLQVLLSKREKEPFMGDYEIKGVLLSAGENAENAIQRKLKDMFNAKVFFEQFHTFTSPNRDPRGRVVSIGFIALINPEKAKAGEWFDVSNLPKVAFDHKEIVLNARDYLKKNLGVLIARQFLPSKFPLNRLQEVYEIVLEEKFDNRNFRKKMLSDGVVVDTGEKQEGTQHRPGKLFKFK